MKRVIVTIGKKIAWIDQAKSDILTIDQPVALRVLQIIISHLDLMRWTRLVEVS